MNAEPSITPLDKIRANLFKCSPSSKPLVLLGTGAFCPVHRHHIKMMEEARESMESNGYTVVGGFLSPSHDLYVENKFKRKGLKGFIPSVHRIEFIKESFVDSDWLEVDPWEATQSRFVDFSSVLHRLHLHLKDSFKNSFPDLSIRVMFVMGADLLVR
jgi:nicotinic acid mononucleotide adenylyltransferase